MGFIVDTKGVEKVINELSSKGLDTLQKKSLRAGAKQLYDDTRSSFVLRLPAAKKNTSLKYDDALLDAVRMNVFYDSSTHEYYFKVHILGSRNKKSGTFRARFFEGGTVERRDKRTGASKGSIRPLNFFRDVVSKDKNVVINTVHEVFYKELNKMVNNG